MNPQATPATKRTWFIIFGALVFALFIYALLCYLILQTRRLAPYAANTVATMRPILGAVGVAVLIGSVAYLSRSMAGKSGGSELMTPRAFQSASIVSLALAEACAIFGLTLFFMGGTIRDYAMFAAGTLFVDFAFILPKAKRYWAAWEEAQKPKPLSPFD